MSTSVKKPKAAATSGMARLLTISVIMVVTVAEATDTTFSKCLANPELLGPFRRHKGNFMQKYVDPANLEESLIESKFCLIQFILGLLKNC